MLNIIYQLVQMILIILPLFQSKKVIFYFSLFITVKGSFLLKNGQNISIIIMYGDLNEVFKRIKKEY